MLEDGKTEKEMTRRELKTHTLPILRKLQI